MASGKLTQRFVSSTSRDRTRSQNCLQNQNLAETWEWDQEDQDWTSSTVRRVTFPTQIQDNAYLVPGDRVQERWNAFVEEIKQHWEVSHDCATESLYIVLLKDRKYFTGNGNRRVGAERCGFIVYGDNQWLLSWGHQVLCTFSALLWDNIKWKDLGRTATKRGALTAWDWFRYFHDQDAYRWWACHLYRTHLRGCVPLINSDLIWGGERATHIFPVSASIFTCVLTTV
jgi:hypothetical protein